jgi:hypothetical protein
MNLFNNYSFNYNYIDQNSIFIHEKPTSYSDGNIHKEYDENNYELKNKEIPIEKKEKIKPGRKRKRDNNRSEHSKFSNDNKRRKIKSLLLKYILIFINEKIYSMYNGNIGKGVLEKKLKTLEQSQISNATIEFNKELLKKKLEEILSKNISKKFTNFNSNHNKLLIKKLINGEEDKNKRNYFKRLFDLTFIDCLKQFRGEEKFEELEGLEFFDNINEIKFEYLNKYKDGEEYIKKLRDYLHNYEKNINAKKGKIKKQNDELAQIN